MWSVLFGLVQVLPIFKGRTFGYKVRRLKIWREGEEEERNGRRCFVRRRV